MYHQEETQRKAQDTLEGVCFSPERLGVRVGGAGPRGWGEGSQGLSAEAAAPATRLWKIMDGWMNKLHQ